MTIFERIVQYINSYDSGFAKAVEGAKPEQIAELEELLGMPIPEIYRDFLNLMGRSMDWIVIRKIDFRIETVLSYYRRENWLPADQYIRIGTDYEDPRFHPHLEIWPLGEPEIVCFPACKPNSFDETIGMYLVPFAGSLPEMVCMPVFEMYEIRGNNKNPICLMTESWQKGILKQVQEIATELGFEKLFFSSDSGHAYTSSNAAIQAIQLSGHPLHIFVSADTLEGPHFIAEHFIQRLKIKKV